MSPRFALLACLFASGVGCQRTPPEEGAPPLPRVRVAIVAPAQAVRGLRVAGLLSAPPVREVRLSPRVPGRLSQLRVAEGDRVRAGEVLAQVDTVNATAELQQAEASLREATSALEAAKEKRARTDVLAEHGVAARQDAEQDRSAEAAARAAEARARSALELARRGLGRTSLQAPFDGVVTAIGVRQGEMVEGANPPVVQVSATDPLELRAFVTQQEAAAVQPGQRATLTVDGLDGAREGEVAAVSPSVDPQSGNVLIRLRFANPGGELRLGATARAHIVMASLGSALAVPPSALLPQEDGGVAVARFADGRVHRVPVQVISEDEGGAVVQGPLAVGEPVVVEGGYSLPDDAGVEVLR
ncbi:efflux RND transporter periplasmic adaptor subunit [Corallococcus carmarthensis]|uniref:efflux RND transporter periplasmic adaptor subunit n=1 Tax=Corallococcus carmarthensis TaxID=2316728 RepID=UPI00148BC4D3|nr:efflux RND transporter periplasmic adaptor subunit [Corallococcus carmarthensis]NOK18427.1 efflux RND transporter periplasmic adaptor subunit [Corallococcus carmarthensis]